MLKEKTRLINELEMLYTLSERDLKKIRGGGAGSCSRRFAWDGKGNNIVYDGCNNVCRPVGKECK